MLDHIHVMDRRMEAMSRALEEQGITRHFEHLNDLDGCGIDLALPDAPAEDPGPDDRSPPAASGLP
jgi:serine O-acetyltransferase